MEQSYDLQKSKYQAKIQEAKELQDDMVVYDKRAKQTINLRAGKMLKEHHEDIRKAIKKESLTQKLDLVHNAEEKRMGVLYYSDEIINLTQAVIDTLNSEKK
jgi:hypothetical protein